MQVSKSPAECPHCGSSDIRFREKRGDWLCDACDHRWNAPAPAEAIASVAIASAADRATTRPQKVFVSYGRADATEFVQRLARDLQERGGHEVWIDLQSIEKGGLFEVRIEHGIRDCTVFAAVMTRRSLEENSVCRDEVVFALNEGKRVVPLRADPDPDLKPSLLLARRIWIDFTDEYESALDALLGYLSGNEAALLPPRLPKVSGVTPLDFGVEIAKFHACFTGREWVGMEVDRWLSSAGKRAFVIVAEPGVGKSAIAAWLSQTRSNVVGIHFCTQQNSRSRDPFEFVASVVGQLQARLPGFVQLVEARNPEVRRNTATDAFRELVVEPVRCLAEPECPQLIVVDALDEAATQQGETVIDVLVRQAPDLPSWLRIVTTTRPEEPILRRIRNLNVFELQTDRRENREDVRAYIESRLATNSLAERIGAKATSTEHHVASLADGNFLYARMALDALEEGHLTIQDLGRLSPGLSAFYAEAFSQRFPDLEEYSREFAPLLRALVAARAPLPFKLLTRSCDQPAELIHRRLLDLQSYLRIFEEGDSASYVLFHKSLRDWLSKRDEAGPYWCDEEAGHRQLADILEDQWQTDENALRRLPTHLIGCGEWDRLEDILCDLQFLERKVATGLVFELVADYTSATGALPVGRPRRRILQLLEEALRRDVHFIARHAEDYPQALFQCLWNSCWWYDSADAAEHYVIAGGNSGAWPLQRSGARISELLESWRRQKRGSTGPWARSLRPPETPLGMGQKAVLRGHVGQIWSVVYSHDDLRIATGSSDKTVRIWNASSGEELLRPFEHPEAVWSVTFTPDGHYLVSGAKDHKVRVWDLANGSVESVLCGHTSDVESVAVSADGQQILSGSRDGTARVWRRADGREQCCFSGHRGAVRSVCFSPDGRFFATASDDRSIRILDTKGNSELLRLEGHSDAVRSVSFSPDGKQLVSTSFDRTVRLWDVDEGTELACLLGHTARVCDARFFPDGTRIASVSDDGTLRVWAVHDRAQSFVVNANTGPLASLAISADGEEILSGSWDSTVRRLTVLGHSMTLEVRDHDNVVTCMTFSKNGELLLTGGADATVRVWDVASGTQRKCLYNHWATVSAVAFSPDARLVASGSQDGTLRLWDTWLGRELACRTVPWVQEVHFSVDGRQLSYRPIHQRMRVWDIGDHVAELPDSAAPRTSESILEGRADAGQALAPVSAPLRPRLVPSGINQSSIAQHWVARANQSETVIQDAATQRPIAWFPETLEHFSRLSASERTRVKAHPERPLWAGVNGKHLYLIVLEGIEAVGGPQQDSTPADE